MLRETTIPRKLLVFDEEKAYIVSKDPKKVQQIVISNKSKQFKIGSKIELEKEDMVIIIISLRDKIIISVSTYCGFGKFCEVFYEIAKLKGYSVPEDFLEERERNIIKIAAQKLAS